MPVEHDPSMGGQGLGVSVGLNGGGMFERRRPFLGHSARSRLVLNIVSMVGSLLRLHRLLLPRVLLLWLDHTGHDYVMAFFGRRR
jgi:hypothetical protein